MLITSPAAVKKAFERVDRSRSGSLNPSGVAEFLRELFKDLRPRDVHYLLQVRRGYEGEDRGPGTCMNLLQVRRGYEGGCLQSYAGEGSCKARSPSAGIPLGCADP